jgi:putative protease
LQEVELLSPGGNLEKLTIAFDYGADAVYAGVSSFSLRIRSTKEFDDVTFKEGVDYAHSIGKKVYSTVNGFPFNSQVKLLYSHIEKMAKIAPDAFIVSTPGVIKAVQEVVPDMELHLSTQANVMNYLDAKFYYDLGIRRVIVAREISLKDAQEIKARLPDLELEIFVHGSMCFAYSGRCLISAVQSGRVPNKGSCANDCRFDYNLYAENPDNGTLFRLEEDAYGTYIMNAKDLNMSAHIKEILDSGAIDSLKIEGRTKSQYYTAVTTRAYREAIDDYYGGVFDAKKYVDELNTTANRGFTDAYLVSRPYEREDTQNNSRSMEEGTHQVHAMVSENGETFLSKGQVYPNKAYELVMPKGTRIEPCDNEIGKIYHQEGEDRIVLYKLEAENGKVWESVHSGNVNRIKLPVKLPRYTFFRHKI